MLLAVLGQCTSLQHLALMETSLYMVSPDIGVAETQLGSFVVELVRSVHRLRELRVRGSVTTHNASFVLEPAYIFDLSVKPSGAAFSLFRVSLKPNMPQPTKMLLPLTLGEAGRHHSDLASSILKSPQGRLREVSNDDVQEAYRNLKLRVFGEGRSNISNNPYCVSWRTRSRQSQVVQSRGKPRPVFALRMALAMDPGFSFLKFGPDGERILIQLLRKGSDGAVTGFWLPLDAVLNPAFPDHFTQGVMQRICALYALWCSSKNCSPQHLTVNPRLMVNLVKELAWKDHGKEKRMVHRLTNRAIRVDTVLERERLRNENANEKAKNTGNRRERNQLQQLTELTELTHPDLEFTVAAE